MATGRRLFGIGGLVVGLAAVVLQAWLTIGTRLGSGDSLPVAIVFFLSFFTILSNAVLVLVYLSEFVAARWLDWFRSPVTRGMMVAVMILVLVTYHLLLASIWDPQGLFKVCDVTLHYVAPILYVLWWIVFLPHRRLSWLALPFMLLPTLAYFIYAMIRGALTGVYPYPFLEANRIGYPAVAQNAVFMLIFVVVLSAIVIMADKMLPERRMADG